MEKLGTLLGEIWKKVLSRNHNVVLFIITCFKKIKSEAKETFMKQFILI